MARRERLCPEITDPALRGFLDMLPDLRAYNRQLVLTQMRFAQTTEFALPGRKISICFHQAKDAEGNLLSGPRPVLFEYHGGGFMMGDAEKTDGLRERIARDLKNSLSRIDNCEIANVEKSIRAGQKQLQAISKIIEHDKFDTMGEKLMNVADIRVRYPEASLLELCDFYQKNYGEVISKSGMKHRLNKIESLADSLEEKE